MWQACLGESSLKRLVLTGTQKTHRNSPVRSLGKNFEDSLVIDVLTWQPHRLEGYKARWTGPSSLLKQRKDLQEMPAAESEDWTAVPGRKKEKTRQQAPLSFTKHHKELRTLPNGVKTNVYICDICNVQATSVETLQVSGLLPDRRSKESSQTFAAGVANHKIVIVSGAASVLSGSQCRHISQSVIQLLRATELISHILRTAWPTCLLSCFLP